MRASHLVFQTKIWQCARAKPVNKFTVPFSTSPKIRKKMSKKLSNEFIIRFDAAFDKHMESAFPINENATGAASQHWRHRCHQSAKIAARSIGMLLGDQAVQLVRVQLRAQMEDGDRFVDLGNPNDPPTAARRYSMHWAVRIGSSLYDPTALWQLRFVKTQLDLPPEPYFFAQDFFKISVPGPGGGFVVAYHGPRVKLFLDYKLILDPLPDDIVAMMLPDGLVRNHARKVVKIFA